MAEEAQAPVTQEPGYLINDSKVGADGKMFIGGNLDIISELITPDHLSIPILLHN